MAAPENRGSDPQRRQDHAALPRRPQRSGDPAAGRLPARQGPPLSPFPRLRRDPAFTLNPFGFESMLLHFRRESVLLRLPFSKGIRSSSSVRSVEILLLFFVCPFRRDSTAFLRLSFPKGICCFSSSVRSVENLLLFFVCLSRRESAFGLPTPLRDHSRTAPHSFFERARSLRQLLPLSLVPSIPAFTPPPAHSPVLPSQTPAGTAPLPPLAPSPSKSYRTALPPAGPPPPPACTPG